MTTAPLVAIRWSSRQRRPGSWHLMDHEDSKRTLCGRSRKNAYVYATRPELPGDERTCERCAVIASKRAAS